MEKVLTIKKLKDTSNDYQFWMSKTPKERLQAIETLRQQYIKYTNVQPGLQRVCAIIRKTSN